MNGVGGSNSTVNGGNGADDIKLSGFTGTGAKIGAGKGSDSISFVTNTGMTGSVAGGGLADTISFTKIAGVTIYGDAHGTTTAGSGAGGAADGNDLIGGTSSLAGNSTIYGGGGADTIKLKSATGRIDAGNGNDSIYLTTAFDGAASINGGAGADSITYAASGIVDLLSAHATINGGAGNDVITYQGSAVSAGLVLGGTAVDYNFVVAGANAGDKIILDAATLGVTTAGATNWNQGVPTLYIGSAIVAATLGSSDEGSVQVWENGGDTFFAVNNSGTTNFLKFVIKGSELVSTTKTGAVAFNSTNFAFTLAEHNSVASTGVVITLS